jgi:hypothetical protein
VPGRKQAGSCRQSNKLSPGKINWHGADSATEEPRSKAPRQTGTRTRPKREQREKRNLIGSDRDFVSQA